VNAIVTTPKREIDNSKREGDAIDKDGGHWFRVFKFKPKVEQGDRLYFCEAGSVTGYGVVISVEQLDLPENCDVTGRQWGSHGDWVVRYNDWHWLDNKPAMKGFQGIRYVERLSDELKDAMSKEKV